MAGNGIKLLERVGEGGMSTVWKAWDESRGCYVAVKVLAGEFATSGRDIESFREEERVMEEMDNPGIVKAYGFEQDGDGCRMIMEYVDGYTFGDLLRRKQHVGEADCLLICESVAAALDVAWNDHGVVHCDIKPENIMVTKHGKELVLIDFGRSQDLVDRRVYQHYNDQVRKRFMADYTDRQWQDIGKDNFYSYGTVGYTAPECYAQAENGLYPFINQIGALQYGSISIESDIFGFGATFWECFYSYELCRKAFESVEEATDPSFFNKAITKYYEDRIHQEQVLDYCDRDFRDVDIAFHESIEAILKKCTRTREQGFQEPAKTPNTYYHNFAVLQNDVERARDAIPSLDRKSDPLVRQMIGVAGFCGAAMACFLVLFILLEVFANVFAWDKWGRLTNSYTENQIAMLIDISEEMMKVPLEKNRQENLNEIVRFMHGGAPNDDVIDQEEASLVTGLLQKHFRNQSTWGPYLDEVMQYARSDNMDAVAKSVYRINLKDEQSSEGYRLAKAIAQVNDADDGDAEVLISAYRTATEMAGKPQYQRAVSKLAGKLLTGKKVDTIAAGLQTNRSDIREQLNAIER